jgi:hypothetical protein
MSRYIPPVKWLGSAAIILLLFAVLFANVAPSMVSEETRNAVLFHAIPFFAGFVAVLLTFILLIVLVALRFNGKIPGRTYRGVEYVIITGILFGTVCLFNPWSFVPYRYGFLLVLVSTLSFIVWSHITPPRASMDAEIEPLTTRQHAMGVIAGLIVLAVLTSSFMSITAPKVPFGLRQRVWDSYDADRQAQVAADASQEFNSVEVPFLLIFNLLPATAIYLLVREIGADRRKSKAAPYIAAAATGTD